MFKLGMVAILALATANSCGMHSLQVKSQKSCAPEAQVERIAVTLNAKAELEFGFPDSDCRDSISATFAGAPGTCSLDYLRPKVVMGLNDGYRLDYLEARRVKDLCEVYFTIQK